ncbi:hypothetical protein [Anaerocolumna xylanovorans]|uniref:DUF3899 domain-containing protein n=1 Tax=Anaerocolumna xylanovorans DSM 12503 TaxID=1121345 RepID=A0A1M7YFP3_9FIRM|nr:hypothetical protein [Anaerocolumna xylanovorans]SHO51433.1 hypothetical protein SAMN02745217_03190 [Anaerocolumna xylanovorans DSM 12503]
MKKRKQMGAFGWIVVFFLFIAAMVGICYLISRHFNYDYMHVLESVGILLIAIGGVSSLGDLSIRSNVRDNQTKLSRKWSRGFTEDIKLAADNRAFSVIMGIAGILLLVVPVIFNIR